jgi:hypothetical protein
MDCWLVAGSMDRLIVLFCEDRGHEQFCRALLKRLLREGSVTARVEAPSARGGHGAAVSEFRAWQSAVVQGSIAGVPSLLVLVVDGNCQGWNSAKQDLAKEVRSDVFRRTVIGCPDPHIERWCLADSQAFKDVVGGEPPRDPDKCERDLYKRLLRDAILGAGQPILTDAMEFAPDLVERADLYAASRAQPSLGGFIDDLRAAIKQIVIAE